MYKKIKLFNNNTWWNWIVDYLFGKKQNKTKNKQIQKQKKTKQNKTKQTKTEDISLKLSVPFKKGKTIDSRPKIEKTVPKTNQTRPREIHNLKLRIVNLYLQYSSKKKKKRLSEPKVHHYRIHDFKVSPIDSK